MRHSYRPAIPPKPQPYRTQSFEHLGLVAGMFDALGMAAVIEKATQQNPEMRLVPAGQAVTALVLNGLGFVNQQLSLVPHFFQHKPPSRLIAPAIPARHLNDDTLGRALETLYDFGVTALYRLIAATAAQRLGLAPTLAHRASTSFHVDGRSHRAEPPDEQGLHRTQGSSRAHRPALNHGMRDLMVEPQAGMPVVMHPRSGHSREATDFGQIVRAHLAPWRTTSGTTSLGADRARESAANLQKLAEAGVPWIPRVPATWREAPVALAQADPQTLAPLPAG